MATPRTVYLAGPDVFLPDAVELGARKKALCERHGFTGLYPLDEIAAPAASDLEIYRACVALLRRADFGIAHLTPFRGASADVGTVYELGVLIALGKTVFGYTNDAADLLTRVRQIAPVTRDEATGVWRDGHGLMIEDFGNADNLMIDAALAAQGFPIIRIDAPPAERYRDLTGFEACLKRAVAHFGTDHGPNS